jgi:regulator of sigma E protease
METLLAFLFVLSVLVFVHEYGHYWVAIKNGVKVEAFSIGFGPELFGWMDKKGTRWKVSLIPLGGYVKMFGDMNPASAGHRDDLDSEEIKHAFHHKGVAARAAIVIAGPLANFLFAIVVFAVLFSAVGQQRALPVVGEVLDDSPAAIAGLVAEDRITEIDGTPVDWFSELSEIVRANPETALSVSVMREGVPVTLSIVPEAVAAEDGQSFGRLGVTAGAFETNRDGIVEGIGRAFETTYSLTAQTFAALGEMISGDRDSSELGGPIRIAQMSGQVAEGGLAPLLFFMGYLSISLGLINLMPVPVLDGGHLVFYAIEGIRGKPLGAKAQEYGFRIGAGLVFSLIIFATWNDLTQLGVFSFLKGLAG